LAQLLVGAKLGLGGLFFGSSEDLGEWKDHLANVTVAVANVAEVGGSEGIFILL
jgi:hypothetical protein